MTEARKWIEHEQLALWTDLEKAIQRAANGAWSMESADVARRIVGAARLVGPTPWGEVQWVLSAGGVYEELLKIGSVAFTLPRPAELARSEVMMTKYGSPSYEAAHLMMSQTIAAMTSPREVAYIRDDS